MMLRAIVAAAFMAGVATAFSPPMAHALARTANSHPHVALRMAHESQPASGRGSDADVAAQWFKESRGQNGALRAMLVNALIAEQDQEERKKKEEAASSAPQPPMIEADEGLQHWKEQKAADRAKQDEEVEAKMARWMAEAAAKKG